MPGGTPGIPGPWPTSGASAGPMGSKPPGRAPGGGIPRGPPIIPGPMSGYGILPPGPPISNRPACSRCLRARIAARSAASILMMHARAHDVIVGRACSAVVSGSSSSSGGKLARGATIKKRSPRFLELRRASISAVEGAEVAHTRVPPPAAEGLGHANPTTLGREKNRAACPAIARPCSSRRCRRAQSLRHGRLPNRHRRRRRQRPTTRCSTRSWRSVVGFRTTWWRGSCFRGEPACCAAAGWARRQGPRPAWRSGRPRQRRSGRTRDRHC